MAPLFRSLVATLALIACTTTGAATLTWIGFGNNADWSNPQNWTGGIAPATGDHLVFPAGAVRSTANNDFVGGSFDGIDVASIYSFTGNALTLTGTRPFGLTGGGAIVDVRFDLTFTNPNATVAITAGAGPDSRIAFFGPTGITPAAGQFILDAGAGWIVVNTPICPTPFCAVNIELAGNHVSLNRSTYSTGTFFSHAKLLDTGWFDALGYGANATIQGGLQHTNVFGGSPPTNVLETLIFPIAGTASPPADLTTLGEPGTYFANVQAMGGPMRLQAGAYMEIAYLSSPGVLVDGNQLVNLSSPNNPVSGLVEVRRGTLRTTPTPFTPVNTSVSVDPGAWWQAGQNTQLLSFGCKGTFEITLGATNMLETLQSADVDGCTLMLDIPPALAPAPGTEYPIVRASGAALTGKFVGAPEAAPIDVNGTTMYITYKGLNGQSASLTTVRPVTVPMVQDMWWGGSSQNGWGMSIVQHGEKLFVVIYAYDAAGRPTWFVVPAGSWDVSETVYSGDVYSPTGSPFYVYDASKFHPGLAVGNVTLTFPDANHMTLDYTINGASGHNSLTRQSFGAQAISTTNWGDMWWGEIIQNGWGVAILQQFDSFFAVWFTYDANGLPTWFVMPAGTWTALDVTWEGRMYRTTGSPWLGHTYDPSQLRVFDTGPFRLRFLSKDNVILDYNVDGRTGSLFLDRQPF